MINRKIVVEYDGLRYTVQTMLFKEELFINIAFAEDMDGKQVPVEIDSEKLRPMAREVIDVKGAN